MNKFWLISIALLVVGAGAVLVSTLDSQQRKIEFTDLETECRVSEEANVALRLKNDRVVFSGHYPERDSDADLSYDYRQTSDRIVLNVKSQTRDQNIYFPNDCLASVVYRAETSRIQPGLYDLVVKHNGETVTESTLRIP